MLKPFDLSSQVAALDGLANLKALVLKEAGIERGGSGERKICSVNEILGARPSEIRPEQRQPQRLRCNQSYDTLHYFKIYILKQKKNGTPSDERNQNL